jgi:hypothetical protein
MVGSGRDLAILSAEATTLSRFPQDKVLSRRSLNLLNFGRKALLGGLLSGEDITIENRHVEQELKLYTIILLQRV